MEPHVESSKKLSGFNLVSTQVSGQIIRKQGSLAWDSPPKPTIFIENFCQSPPVEFKANDNFLTPPGTK